MADKFQGDPRMYLTADGAELGPFTDGQPVMDQGLENAANISLFTLPGFAGNHLVETDAELVGSEYERTAAGPITIDSFRTIQNAARTALAWMIGEKVAGDIEARAFSSEGLQVDSAILIKPVGNTNDPTALLVTRNANNWISQFFDPAHLKGKIDG